MKLHVHVTGEHVTGVHVTGEQLHVHVTGSSAGRALA